MKTSGSPCPPDVTTLVPAQLRKQACRVFGGGTTVQLFGSGGRVLAGDGRQLDFANMTEWERLIERERPASKAPPSRGARRAEDRAARSKMPQRKSASMRKVKETSTTSEDPPKKRSLRFIWEML
jgi:hypothetical protein